MLKYRIFLVCLLLLVGCGDSRVISNVGNIEDDAGNDAFEHDTMSSDSGSYLPDTGGWDSGVPDDVGTADSGWADAEELDGEVFDADAHNPGWADATDSGNVFDPNPADTASNDVDEPDLEEEAWYQCPAGGITNGWNKMQVGGRERGFFADLPADHKRSMGLLFSWHGFLERAAFFRLQRGFNPNAVANLPMAILTPEDTFMLPLPPEIGLGWDVRPGDSRDLHFFLAMIDCMDAQFPVMHEAIYSYGFSAGAVMSALIHSTFPDIVNTVYLDSGGWFNDPDQRAVVNPLIATLLQFTWNWRWPGLDWADGGTAVVTNGGPHDQIRYNVFGMDLYIFNLQAAAHAAVPFLREHGRRVLNCEHTAGHMPHPGISTNAIQHFLAAHRTGAPRPVGHFGLPGSCQELHPY